MALLGLIAWGGWHTATVTGRPALDLALEAFLDARLRRDEPAARRFLAAGARRQFTDAGEPLAGVSNPHWTYFATRGWNGPVVTVVAHQGYTGQPFASYREEYLTWGRVGGEWRITGTRFGPRYILEVTRDGAALEYNYPNGSPPGSPPGSPQPVLRLADLPAEFTPAGAAPEIRFGVGRDRFGPLAISPTDPRLLAFTTSGVHGFLGLANVTGKVRGLDLYFEGDALEIRWSADGRYLLADILSPSGDVRTLVYDVASGARLPMERLRAYPLPLAPSPLILGSGNGRHATRAGRSYSSDGLPV